MKPEADEDGGDEEDDDQLRKGLTS
ncbi:uncharacterized protein METZ01_LOCUS192021 [marine metagenome]|uniref:Uncharacterized protein n=1 Tax=marine metagenome TaxID=408172 RepID=A0A382DNI6_9ZZZZ